MSVGLKNLKFDEEKKYSVSGKFLNALCDTVSLYRETTVAEIYFKVGYFYSIIEKEDFNELS